MESIIFNEFSHDLHTPGTPSYGICYFLINFFNECPKYLQLKISIPDVYKLCKIKIFEMYQTVFIWLTRRFTVMFLHPVKDTICFWSRTTATNGKFQNQVFSFSANFPDWIKT